MKTILEINRKVFFVFVLFLMVQVGWCQTYSEDTTNSQTNTELNGQQVSQSAFNSFFDTTPNEQLTSVTGNSVFLTQVASNNTAIVKVASRASDINILQNGSDNSVGLFYKVDAVIADVEQNGNRNVILDYVIDPNAKVSLDIKQNGDNLTFDKFGSNNMTKNIKFTQTEASPTIIVRSFQ
ncbi:MAG: hypothetical protein KBT58_06810 [Bizionia sp.]|nr:hypothetical protein [Bizionia sp.]